MPSDDRPTLDDAYQDEHGVCPVCLRQDGFVNIGRDHWFYCERHRVTWCAGSNLFSSWREQTETDWRSNAAMLAGYRVVTPAGHERDRVH